MPAFVLGPDVHANVHALRVALGSITRELSTAELAKMIADRHPGGRAVSSTVIQRWEKGGVEPDIHSIRLMAELAGVAYEQFALGTGTRNTERPAVPPPVEDTRPSYVRLAEQAGVGTLPLLDPEEELRRRGLLREPAKKTAASKGRRGKH
jgi:transcriptional regulator with XRE-family HTH domain